MDGWMDVIDLSMCTWSNLIDNQNIRLSKLNDKAEHLFFNLEIKKKYI